MSKLIMIINKFGRFVGKSPNKGDTTITLRDAVQVVDVMGPKGPMVSGAILGDIHTLDHDVYVYLDSKSTYYAVYHQCISDIVPAKSIITGK